MTVEPPRAAATVIALLAALVLVPGVPGGTVVPPGCGTGVASAPRLAVRPSFVKVPGSPFGVVTAAGGRAVVSLSEGSLAAFAGGHLRRVVQTPSGETPSGIALSPDGARLYAADGFGLSVHDARSLTRLRALADRGTGAIYVRLSRDGRFAFVTDEWSATVSVFRPGAKQALVGTIHVPAAPVGLALSGDGGRLFVTSEAGTLSEIDVARAERTPWNAVIRHVGAGCVPVRVVLAPNGKQLWVSARGSNAVLAYDATTLALRRVVRVGAAPVGLAFVGAHTLVVANSNRFAGTGPQTLTVVDTASGRVRGSIRAGTFPRELAVSRDGRLLYVTNYGSATVEVVATKDLR